MHSNRDRVSKTMSPSIRGGQLPSGSNSMFCLGSNFLLIHDQTCAYLLRNAGSAHA